MFKKSIKNKVKALAPLFFLHTPRPFSASIAGLKKFHNKFDNETCVIIGNGPSLNLIDFDLVSPLKTFAVNGIFYKTDELGFVPSFYVVEDGAVMKDNKKRINDYEPKIASFSLLFTGVYSRQSQIGTFLLWIAGFMKEEAIISRFRNFRKMFVKKFIVIRA